MAEAGQELGGGGPNPQLPSHNQTGDDVTDGLTFEDEAGPEHGPHQLQGLLILPTGRDN